MRRFIAFIVLVFSMLGLVVFNVQANTEKINWSQEFNRGTEVVYTVENTEDNTDKIDMDKLVETMGARLEQAGATSHRIDYSLSDDDRYEVRIALGARYQADIDNILRSTVSAGELSLYTTDELAHANDPFVRGTAEVLYDDNSQAYVRVEVTKDVKDASDKTENDNKLMVLWQGKTEDMMYAELKDEDYSVGGKTNEQLKDRVLAVINLGDTTSETETDTSGNDNSLLKYDEDNDKYYLTFDAYGYADNAESSTKMDAKSAHSFERILNADKINYDITEVYRTTINAEYGNNSATMIIISIAVCYVAISAYLLISYGMMAISGIVGIGITGLFDLLIINFLNIQAGPAFIISVLVSLFMAVTMLLNYYKRTKEEAYNGRLIAKASNEGFRKTISTAVDSTVLLLILGIVLAVVSKESVKTFSIFFIITSIISVLFIFLLSKCLNNFLLNSNVADNNKLFNYKKEFMKDLDGHAEKEINDSVAQKLKVNKQGKKPLLFAIGGLTIALVSILVFTFTGNTFNYTNEANYGRLEIRSGVTEIFEDKGDNLAETNFVNYIEGLSDDIKVTKSWTITDQKNPYEKDKNYIYFYANLEKPLSTDSDAYDAIEAYVKQVDDEYGLVTSYTVYPGVVRGDFTNTLILTSITVGIGLVYFIIRYRYTFALSTIISSIVGTTTAFGLISLTRLEVSSSVGIGVLAGLIMSLLLFIPFGNRLRQLKNESKVKVTTFEQREEITMASFKSTINEYCISTIMFTVLLLAFIPLNSLQMAPIFIATIISLLVNAIFGILIVVPLHLWFEKTIKFNKFKSKRAELRKAKREKTIKANRNKGAEPEEIIIPGIND